MAYDHRQHTVAENLEMARTVGDHIGKDLCVDPFMRMANLAIHFVTTGMKCPLCLQEAVDGGEESVGAGKS